MVPKDWLHDHGPEIEEAQRFSLDDLPEDPGTMAQHLSMSQGLYARTGYLLGEAETFTLRAHAVAVMETRKKYPELSAAERAVVAKSDEQYLGARRLRDNLEVLATALKNKAYALMNIRRTTLDPKVQSTDEN